MPKNLMILSSYLGETRKTTAGYKQEMPSGCLFPSFIGLLSSDRRCKESLLSRSASSQASQTSLLPAILYHRHIRAGSPHRQSDFRLQRFLLRVHSRHIPFVTVTTRQNDVFSGITVDETDIIPRRGHLLHEIYRPSRSVRQVVGSEGKVLHGRLEQYGRGQRVDIGCHPAAAARFVLRIIILVQRTATEVHAGHRIPYERMQAGIESLGIATLLRKVQVFTGQYRLTARMSS